MNESEIIRYAIYNEYNDTNEEINQKQKKLNIDLYKRITHVQREINSWFCQSKKKNTKTFNHGFVLYKLTQCI